MASPAVAAPAPYQATSPADEPLRFDDTIAFNIPPQPLLAALRTYSELTGQAVLVDNTLATGRYSPGVSGNFDKTEALRRLLAGTGLVASYSSDQAFTLKLAQPDEGAATPAREEPESLGGGGIEAVIEQYAGKIQKPIEAALCQSDETRPGTYRLALQIWIAPSGRIERSRLLSPTGVASRDDEVRRALSELVLDPPPAGMPQPITLLLLPRHKTSIWACAASRSVH